jgi:hypothetical protein
MIDYDANMQVINQNISLRKKEGRELWPEGGRVKRET